MRKRKSRGALKRLACLVLTGIMLFGEGTAFGSFGGGLAAEKVSAAEATVITSLEYYDAANGATQEKTGVSGVSFGFVMPKFNGLPYSELALTEVQDDLELQVDVDGTWTNIDDVPYFQFNSTWGWEFQDWGGGASGWICWFKLDETTRLRFHGKTNDVNLEYTLTLNKLDTLSVTSISNSESPIQADATGGSATHWNKFVFNGNADIIYDQVKDDLEFYVDNHDDKGFVPLLANAASGFIWDSNFGVYTDGFGGFWFKNIDWSFTLRVQKKDDATVYSDVEIVYTEPDRSVTTLAAFEGKVKFDANEAANNVASVGMVLPTVNNTNAVKSDLEKFVYQVCEGAVYDSASNSWSGGEWVALSDAESWLYQDSGYNKYSARQQWGYFVDGVYGLWFQPVLKDTYLRIGYPVDGCIASLNAREPAMWNAISEESTS